MADENVFTFRIEDQDTGTPPTASGAVTPPEEGRAAPPDDALSLESRLRAFEATLSRVTASWQQEPQEAQGAGQRVKDALWGGQAASFMEAPVSSMTVHADSVTVYGEGRAAPQEERGRTPDMREGTAAESSTAAREIQYSPGTAAPPIRSSGFGGGSAAPEVPAAAAPELGGVGAAGEAGAAAGAAGVAGAALAAVEAASHKMAEAIRFASDRLTDFGHVAAATAFNDNFRALSVVGDKVGSALGKIPVAGEAIEASFHGASAAVRTFTEVTDAFNQRARQLAPYSGAITAAQVQAQARTRRADIEEARDLGPDLARFIEAQNSASLELRQAIEPLKRFIIDTLADFWEWATDFMRNARGDIAAVSKAIELIGQAIVEAIQLHVGRSTEILGSIPKEMQKAFEEATKKNQASKVPWGVEQAWDLANIAGMPGGGAAAPGWLQEAMRQGRPPDPGDAPAVRDQAFAGAGGDF
jgi:hypothetical protein